jgi:uncharacterized membrane protein
MHRRFDPQFFVDRHPGWYWPHFVFTFVVLAVLVALGFWLVTNARRHAHGHHAMPMGPPTSPTSAIDPALQEARMRYARGEISREDFLAISADLGGSPPPPGPPPAS